MVHLGPDLSIEALSDELRRLRQQAGGSPDKLAILRTHVIEQLRALHYSRDRIRLAKQLLTPHPRPHRPRTTPPPTYHPQAARVHWPTFLPTLKEKLAAHLLTPDPDLVEMILATALTHFLPGRPAWLFVMGPPSTGKTELLSMLHLVANVIPLVEVTRNTFFSGYNPKDEPDQPPAFLHRHTNHILTFDDFTVMLALRADVRAEIMAQLRKVFDGYYRKPFGTGQDDTWTGRITILAGVTSALDKYHHLMAALGPRFLIIRPQQPDRHATAMLAATRPPTPTWQREIRELVADHLAHLPPLLPTIPPALLEQMAHIAELTTWGRSVTDREDRELTGEADIEGAPRLLHQLRALALALAILHGRDTVDDSDLVRLCRIGWDTLPPVRRFVLRQLTTGPKAIHALRRQTTYSPYILEMALRELHVLRMVHPLADAAEFETHAPWDLTDEVRRLLTAMPPMC